MCAQVRGERGHLALPVGLEVFRWRLIEISVLVSDGLARGTCTGRMAGICFSWRLHLAGIGLYGGWGVTRDA
jgi:hypothetical protein